MTPPRSLQDILDLDSPDLGSNLYSYVSAKKLAGQPFEAIEEEIYLVFSLLLTIEMDGLVDLFHQQYSWRECALVEQILHKLDLNQFAGMFAEAKLIFTDGKELLSEEEYQAINPFDGAGRWQRFEVIGVEMLAEGSQIYLIGERICSY
jgi:hypothetical protein